MTKARRNKKNPSRADRLNDTVELAEKSKNILDELTSDLNDAVELGMDKEQNTKIVDSIIDALMNVEDARDRVQELHDEMESWAGNMEGTNLENTQKYEDVSSARDILDSAVGFLNNIDIKDTAELTDMDASDLLEYVTDAVSELENAIDECSGVEFPGAFGR
jgi:polyhydroxyalkanoate synthesis regulator phasin